MKNSQNRLCVNLLAITLLAMVAVSLNEFFKSIVKQSPLPNHVGFLVYFVLIFIIALLFFNYHKLNPANVNETLDD